MNIDIQEKMPESITLLRYLQKKLPNHVKSLTYEEFCTLLNNVTYIEMEKPKIPVKPLMQLILQSQTKEHLFKLLEHVLNQPIHNSKIFLKLEPLLQQILESQNSIDNNLNYYLLIAPNSKLSQLAEQHNLLFTAEKINPYELALQNFGHTELVAPLINEYFSYLVNNPPAILFCSPYGDGKVPKSYYHYENEMENLVLSSIPYQKLDNFELEQKDLKIFLHENGHYIMNKFRYSASESV